MLIHETNIPWQSKGKKKGHATGEFASPQEFSISIRDVDGDRDMDGNINKDRDRDRLHLLWTKDIY